MATEIKRAWSVLDMGVKTFRDPPLARDPSYKVRAEIKFQYQQWLSETEAALAASSLPLLMTENRARMGVWGFVHRGLLEPVTRALDLTQQARAGGPAADALLGLAAAILHDVVNHLQGSDQWKLLPDPDPAAGPVVDPDNDVRGDEELEGNDEDDDDIWDDDVIFSDDDEGEEC